MKGSVGCRPGSSPSDYRTKQEQFDAVLSVETGENCVMSIRLLQPVFGAIVSGVMTAPTDEDIELDRQWREAFGQPLPMLGAAKIARMVLRQHRDRSLENPGPGQSI